MRMSVWNYCQLLFVGLGLLVLASCGSSGSSTTASSGQLSVHLTDATLQQYQAVYVTIDEVSVHMGSTNSGGSTEIESSSEDNEGGSWQVVATPMQTINLLELVNGVLLELGLTELEAGHYTQLRLLIGATPDDSTNIFGTPHPYANYIIDEDDTAHALKVPSGMQSGIKLVSGFNIEPGQRTELILDFDAAKSVVKAGNSGKWILKPTIKVLDTRTYAEISGNVEDLDTTDPLPGTLVSAQQSSAAYDEADQVVSEAATVTDENGAYKLLVDPGSYNLVAFAEGYEPACTVAEPSTETDWVVDFQLASSDSEATLTGEVNVYGGHDEQPVKISVRQVLDCDGTNQVVEIISDQVANGGSYSFFLPAGTYDVIASTIDQETQVEEDVTLSSGTVTLDFTFGEAPEIILPAGMGALSISLTDATLYQYQAVYVTIDQVLVNVDQTDDVVIQPLDDESDEDSGEWKVVASPGQTVNLLELVNGILLDLGLTEMEPGYYTQLRLVIGSNADNGINIFGNPHPYANYIIDETDETHALKVPSMKVKLVKGFDIYEGEITELILDFDAAKSVVKAGNSGKYLLKPTIKVIDTRLYAQVSGTVTNQDSVALPGTLVSAQQSGAAYDEADQVISEAATVSGFDGMYKLLVAPGPYNLVAFAEGYQPACTMIEPTADTGLIADFQLDQLLVGVTPTGGVTLTGGVTVVDGYEDQPATISVRQELNCGTGDQVVEILSDQVANGGFYEFLLPAGDYRVVASSINEETQADNVTLFEGEETTLDIIFP